MISNDDAYYLANIFNLNLDIVPLNIWIYALEVELEHGIKFGEITNVTNNDLYKTAQIALAHLIEYPDYYQRLYKMEKQAEKYWSKKRKPLIIN